MIVRITKGKDCDYIEACRSDGSVAQSTFPKKGWFPHDAVHFVVESELGYTSAFWGRVADGWKPEDVGALAKAGGHASSSRAGCPDAQIVELLQAERIVECFEVELWSEPSDNETFLSVLSAACAQSKVDSPHLSDENIKNIRAQLHELVDEWRYCAVGQGVELVWE